MFDNPVDTLPLGVGFALSGSFDRGCYTADTAATTAEASGKYRAEWSSSVQGHFQAVLARLLRLEAGARKATRVLIELDSVVVRRASNVRPVIGCDAAARDLLPLRPATVSLLGARAFRYEITRDRAGDLNAEVAAKIREDSARLGLSVNALSGSQYLVTFKGVRWIGGTFESFERRVRDSLYSRQVTVGTPTRIDDWNYEFTAYRDTATSHSGLYTVIVRSLDAGGGVDTVRVANDQSFPIGRRISQPSAGYITLGLFQTGPEGQYQIKAIRQGYARLTWDRQALRDSMLTWTRRREGSQ